MPLTWVGFAPCLFFLPPWPDGPQTISGRTRSWVFPFSGGELLHGGAEGITGDHLAIAKETANILGVGTAIFPADYMKDADRAYKETGLGLREIVHQAQGFAQVVRSCPPPPFVPPSVPEFCQGVSGGQVRNSGETAEGQPHSGHDWRWRQRRPGPQQG